MVVALAAARRRRVWRWAMRAVASAVMWTAVLQLASITGLWRPRVFTDCWGGSGSGGAAAGLAALAGEDRVAARLSPPALVPRSKCSLLLPPPLAPIPSFPLPFRGI